MATKLRPETLEAVKRAAGGGCFMCRMTLASLSPDGVLRDHPAEPKALDSGTVYPADAQAVHIRDWHMKGGHGPWALGS